MTNRRDFLQGMLGAGLLTAGAGCRSVGLSGATGAPMSGFRTEPMKRIRVGVVGLGERGLGPIFRLPTIGGVEITGLCEVVPEKLDRAEKLLKERGAKNKPKRYLGPEAYKALCEADDVDVVYSCTPWHLHTPVALYAMEHGKHAMTEVPAAMSLDECWAQVETAERTRRHCMQLENCCYGEMELLALSLCRHGLLGDLTHGEAAYIHNLSHQALSKVGDPEWWRMDWNLTHKGNQYPTHGLGPICQYMGINRGDQFDYLVSLESRQARMTALMQERQAGRFLGQEVAMGDMNMTLIRTKLGRSILLAHDVSSARPYTRYNTIVGTKGILADFPYRVTFEDRLGTKTTHGFFPPNKAEEVRQRYMHPLWKQTGEIAQKVGGHGGMDFLMDLRWCYCLFNGLPMDMDVYDLAAWCSMCELTERSVRRGSQPQKAVDFTRGAWRHTRPLGLESFDMSKVRLINPSADPNALKV